MTWPEVYEDEPRRLEDPDIVLRPCLVLDSAIQPCPRSDPAVPHLPTMGKKKGKGDRKKKESSREQTPSDEKKPTKRQRTKGSSWRPSAEVLKVVPRKMVSVVSSPAIRLPQI